MVLGTPQPLEQALSSSGIYRISVQNTLQNQKDSNVSELPTQQPAIQAAIQQAFPPALLEQHANTIIDGTYAWVQGKTATPQFSVDLSQQKVSFADSVAAYVQQRSANLPRCLSLSSTPLAANIDPYNTTCRPVQVQPEAIAAQARLEILNSDFLKDPVLTADTIKDSNGKPLTAQLEIVPKAYRWTVRLVYGTGLLALVLIGVIVWLRRRQWQGTLKHLGIMLCTIGIISAGIAWVVSFVLSKITDKLLQSGTTSELIQTKIITIVHTLVNDLRHWWLGYGITLVVIGITAWLFGRSTGAKQRQDLGGRQPGLDMPLPDSESEVASTDGEDKVATTGEHQPPTLPAQ